MGGGGKVGEKGLVQSSFWISLSLSISYLTLTTSPLVAGHSKAMSPTQNSFTV